MHGKRCQLIYSFPCHSMRYIINYLEDTLFTHHKIIEIASSTSFLLLLLHKWCWTQKVYHFLLYGIFISSSVIGTEGFSVTFFSSTVATFMIPLWRPIIVVFTSSFSNCSTIVSYERNSWFLGGEEIALPMWVHVCSICYIG